MTIANVGSMNSFSAMNSVSTDLSSAGTKDTKNADSFSSLMNMASNRDVDTTQGSTDVTNTVQSSNVSGADTSNNANTASDNSKDTTDKVSDSKKSQSAESKDGQKVKSSDKSDKADDVQKTDDKDVNEDDALNEAAEIINQVVTQVEDIITDSLGITDEQLADTMDELGLTGTDLLDPENVLQVAMDVNDISDPVELLGNEELSNVVKDMMSQISDLKEDTQVMELPQEAFDLADDNLQMATDETVTDDNLGMPEITVEVENATQNDTSSSDESFEGQADSQADTKEQVTVTDTANQTVFNNLTEAVDEAMNIQTEDTQAADIVRQIVEEIRTVVKSDTTSMELQLNPANLGKVHIEVVAKEGAITAQITAQTETARAAIEGQIQQLKESFQNQGLKVEAVEVAVDPKGFEQQFEGNQSNQAEEEGKKGSRRQINLDDLDFNEDELTEEEAIQVDMMQRSGNSVNYTA